MKKVTLARIHAVFVNFLARINAALFYKDTAFIGATAVSFDKKPCPLGFAAWLVQESVPKITQD